MAAALSTINPAEFPFIFGDHLVQGYTKGTQITIAYNVDAFTPFKGNDGEGARVMSNDRSVIITVVLQQNSLSNKVLSDIHTSDLNNGNGTKDVSFRDVRGTTVGNGSGAYIMRYADVTVADTVTDRSWRIWVDNYSGTVGGAIQQ
jgi:hypothetical protein